MITIEVVAVSADERRQRQFELGEAHKAAILLMERLELCIGSELVAYRSDVKRIRQAIALELLALDAEVAPPAPERCQYLFGLSGARCQASPRHPIHRGVNDGPDLAHAFVAPAVLA